MEKGSPFCLADCENSVNTELELNALALPGRPNQKRLEHAVGNGLASRGVSDEKADAIKSLGAQIIVAR